MLRRFHAVVVGLVLAMASPAGAAPIFDPASGQGFAGRGDVQTAFGWPAAAFQASAAGVTFTFEGADTYSAICGAPGSPAGRSGPSQTVVIARHGRIGATLHRDARGQADGFNLIGYDSMATDQAAPRQGDFCSTTDLGIRRNGTWSMVNTPIVSGRLFANFAGVPVAIWP